MSVSFNESQVREHLENFTLQSLFVEELGWDHGGDALEVAVGGRSFALAPVAHKRGMVVYQHVAESEQAFPDRSMRLKIERAVAKRVHEHVIIYATHDKSAQYWQWVKRQPGRPNLVRQHTYRQEQTGEGLLQKLRNLVFTLEEERSVTISDATGRVRAAFDVEKVTKRFYERFKGEHHAFLNFIEGIGEVADRKWYASLMLNRMMFVYFIQKRGFLDDDIDYLRNRLRRMQREHGKDRFQNFYRRFLLRLFHEGLGQPEGERAPELDELLGKVPHLNGGLFDVHDLERDNPSIHIPDEAFGKIFTFFEAYQWHLDDRALRKENEINPDVLGYIFEKYINQKQMGAYYTKEDITGYIGRSAIIPFLFHEAKKACPIAFKAGGGVWRLLSDDPDRYFHESARHGVGLELPAEIAAGLGDISQRGKWNRHAPPEYGLPRETWRELIARRRHYEEVRGKIAAGEIASINDFVTCNLDIETFAQDVIANSEGPELIRAFWKAIGNISVLDPTCGSGAFLFAALNILEPIYETCLEAMRGFLDDLERSKRKHHPKTMEDFRKTIERVERHAGERYFILKSIIVGNLYGVDIMEEAVEICKLRLFLKLVAELESYDQIEPLPDIDFNIRAGNTLIGFASLGEVKRAVEGGLFGRLSLPDIEEGAEIADRAFRQFQAMQTEQGMEAKEFSSAKSELREQLGVLRTELDRYLAREYGVDVKDENAYEKWRAAYQPFHWFVEFYGIMQAGGFDVIIGNPPYLEMRKVSYAPKFFATGSSNAIHAMCMERSLALCGKGGSLSMIVPLTLVSTKRMIILQNMLEKKRDCWYSNFSLRPAKLFDQVDIRLTIFVAGKPQEDGETFSTAYNKWYSDNRDHLFPNLRYVECPRNRSNSSVPKLGYGIEHSILEKCLSIPTTMETFTGRSQHAVYYRSAGVPYWAVFIDSAPAFTVEGVAGNSLTTASFTLIKSQHVKPAVAILSSDIFYWYYTIISNMRHMMPRYWQGFPVPASALDDATIRKLGAKYVNDLQANSRMHVRNQQTTGRTETQLFKVRESKHIIDEIDAALAPHYGFSEEELDFLINYEIKFRLGADDGGA